MRTLVVVIFIIVSMSICFAAPPRCGIQQNLPVYAAGGVFTRAEANAIRQRIQKGLLMEVFVPAGTHGKNYWVTTGGKLRSKDYYVESLDTNEDFVKGRYARTDGYHTWFGGESSSRRCDNLWVPERVPVVATPPLAPCPTPRAEIPHDTICETPAPAPCQPQPCQFGTVLKVSVGSCTVPAGCVATPMTTTNAAANPPLQFPSITRTVEGSSGGFGFGWMQPARTNLNITNVVTPGTPTIPACAWPTPIIPTPTTGQT